MKMVMTCIVACNFLNISVNNDVDVTLSRKHNNHKHVINQIDSTHKYYVSVSTVEYSEKAMSLQMITRFFIDDFEDVLAARTDRDIKLGESSELKALQPVITRYLEKKLIVKTDGKNKKINYLGAEYEGDQIVLYTEIPVEQPPQEIEMSFTAFLELFEDQKNLVHCKINGQRKTLLMHLNKKIDSVKF